MLILDLLAVALISLAIDYFLALLLRVSCHLCGVEIPTLSRAMFSVAATIGLSMLAALAIQWTIAEGLGISWTLVTQFVVFALILVAHMLITTALYTPLLRVRVATAFSVWFVQALVFVGFGLVVGCCFGAVAAL
jgi:hypothetical protein